MSLTLKPCPFCGCDKVSIVPNGIGDFFVLCGDEESGCGASSSPILCEGRQQAADRWNRRVHCIPGTRGAGKTGHELLRSAAPDLLAALKAIVAYNCPLGAGLLPQARAAIAKAEGKEAGHA